MNKIKNQTKQIFCGGYCGSGTRVIQLILRKAGYFIGERIGPELDYMPIYDRWGKIISRYLETPTKEIALEFKNRVLEGVLENKPWSIKHGCQMFVMPMIKEQFPQSKFILVIRHGIDNILNQHKMDEDFGEFFIPELMDLQIPERRMRFWTEAYKKALGDGEKLGDDFMVIKLEDLVFKRIETIEKMLDFIGLEYDDINELANMIRVPDSIGRHKKTRIIEDCVYIPEFAEDFYKIGKIILDKFNYKNAIISNDTKG